MYKIATVILMVLLSGGFVFSCCVAVRTLVSPYREAPGWVLLSRGYRGGCVILTVGEVSRSLWGLLPDNITSGYMALPRIQAYQGTMWLRQSIV